MLKTPHRPSFGSIEILRLIAIILGLCMIDFPALGADVEEETVARVKPEGTPDELLLSSTTIAPGEIIQLQWLCQGFPTGHITWSLQASDNGAGHTHGDRGRPTGKTSVESVTIPCDGRYHTSGRYTAPEVSGLVRMSVLINGRPASQPYIDFIVQVQGLQRLPRSRYIEEIHAPAISDVLIKSPPHDHANNHWGKPALNSKILQLAQAFFNERRKKLYVNDMSLPQGGILDINNTWTKPHQTHKDGRHVDIKMVDVMNPDDRRAFRRIAERIFGQRHVCIDGGIVWHLVIETTCTDQVLSEWGLSLNDLKPSVRRELEAPPQKTQD